MPATLGCADHGGTTILLRSQVGSNYGGDPPLSPRGKDRRNIIGKERQERHLEHMRPLGTEALSKHKRLSHFPSSAKTSWLLSFTSTLSLSLLRYLVSLSRSHDHTISTSSSGEGSNNNASEADLVDRDLLFVLGL